MYLYNTTRFCKGQIPKGAINHYFNVADSVLLPDDYNQPPSSPPQSTCPDPGIQD